MRYDISHMLMKYDIHNNYELPRLVSFPRTGSHWFRYIMEVATGTPAIVSSYYYPKPDKCWGLHIHDRWLDNKNIPPTKNLQKVIYLFRDGLDTVYSVLRYDKTIPDYWDGTCTELIDREVKAVTSQYERHLKRWRYNREDIRSCLEIRYDDMAINTREIFEKVLQFLEIECSKEKLAFAIQDATKEKIDSFIIDRNAMDRDSAYNPSQYRRSKDNFREVYESYINSQLKELLR